MRLTVNMLAGNKTVYNVETTKIHLKPKVTVRQFSGYRKIKSIYVKIMLLFKLLGAWQSY